MFPIRKQQHKRSSQSQWLPLSLLSSQNERRYNCSHTVTRRLIERVFGQWKQRLQIPLRLHMNAAKNVVVACACLHNMIKRDQIQTVEDLEGSNAVEATNNCTYFFPVTLIGSNSEDLLLCSTCISS